MAVIIDGKFKSDTDLDPLKHFFIGNFRTPAPPVPSAIIKCNCDRMLHSYDETFEHWQKGHFDLNQYESRKKCDPIVHKHGGCSESCYSVKEKKPSERIFFQKGYQLLTLESLNEIVRKIIDVLDELHEEGKL